MSGSMHIVCPHCTTSYAINLASLGESGRTVRCARCKETWVARPEDAVEPAMAEASHTAREREIAADWNMAEEDASPPVAGSPSIAGDWTDDDGRSEQGKADWIALVRDAALDGETEPRGSWFGNFLKTRRPERKAGVSFGSLTTACAAMAALIVSLIVWRADVVRLLPQTANFYKMVGLNVNLRGLAFKDVKVTTETVELPRLRFSVRDAQGAEIYAWNTVLDQTTLKPGDQTGFKSRLASPPTEGKSIDIRFFNKRDISGGSV